MLSPTLCILQHAKGPFHQAKKSPLMISAICVMLKVFLLFTNIE